LNRIAILAVSNALLLRSRRRMFRIKMNSSSKIPKTRRNLRALFALALLLTLPLSGVGGSMLVVTYLRPNFTLTLSGWEYGQVLLFSSLANLFVYVLIFFQVRRLVWGTEDKNPA
jgi:hypothetical protein